MATKVPPWNPHHINFIDSRILLQYYWCAMSTVFFYDYILTLPDEVCQHLPVIISWSFYPRSPIDQIHVVRTEIIWCARYLKQKQLSTDFRIVFWLFVLVACFSPRGLFCFLTESHRIGTSR